MKTKHLITWLTVIVLFATLVSADISTSGSANEQYNITTTTCKWVLEDGALWSVNYTAITEKANYQSASTSSTLFSVRNHSNTGIIQYSTETTVQSV